MGPFCYSTIFGTLHSPAYLSHSAIREQCMRTGEGFLFVYSITSRNSFEEIRTFHQQISRLKDQDSFPFILVANKCELEYERQVGMDGLLFSSCPVLQKLKWFTEGRDLAKHFGCKFIETSAKQRINVDEVFSHLVRDIRKYNKVGAFSSSPPPESIQSRFFA